MDTLGCGLLALRFPECTKHLGPIVEGTQVPNGARVPGTPFRLDPVKAAWDIGCIIRWLDYNDTWLAAEWGHPSDNLGGIPPWPTTCPRSASPKARDPLTIRDVLEGMIMAHEIQGILALENSFNRVGLDHVVLVKSPPPPSPPSSWAPTAKKSWPRSPTPGSTASPCAPTATPQCRLTQVLGRRRRHPHGG